MKLPWDYPLLPYDDDDGTLSLREISAQQPGMHWNVFLPTISFFIFFNLCFAETNRTPFDLAECETELIGDIPPQ
jgi:NADH-quinone oxidoreductase subunit H